MTRIVRLRPTQAALLRAVAAGTVGRYASVTPGDHWDHGPAWREAGHSKRYQLVVGSIRSLVRAGLVTLDSSVLDGPMGPYQRWVSTEDGRASLAEGGAT